MKKLALFSSASAIGLFALAGPAIADANMTGVGKLYLGSGTTDAATSIVDDPFIYGGSAKGYWPLSPDVHLQVDLFAEQSDNVMRSTYWAETDATTFGAAVHLLHPFEKRARFGVAGSVWNNEEFRFSSDGAQESTYGLVALEGQFFGTDWTVTGQAGIFSRFSCPNDGGEGCGGLDDGTFVRGKVRYYLSDNTAFSLDAAQMWGNGDDDFFSGKSMNTSKWNLEAEHKFEGSDFSGFIALSHEHLESDGFFGATANTQTVSLGVKFYLDQPTLRSNDQTGAELDTPTFSHPLQIIAPIVD